MEKQSCSFDPTGVSGPIGMFHCPECGEMVLAGMSHPEYDDEDAEYEEYLNSLKNTDCN